MIYHISYDLNRPGKDYTKLHEGIKKLGSWCHPVDSTWYVESSNSASQIRDYLKALMDPSDALVVTTAIAPGAWFGLDDDVTSWLKDHLK